MSQLLIVGVIVVNLALVFYTSFFILEQKLKVLNPKVLLFLTIGICFDIIATTCMIIGSKNGAFTLHGILGYSSLLGMMVDTILLWRFKFSNGFGIELPKSLHLFSRFAYIWWVIAYVTGAMLVMLK